MPETTASILSPTAPLPQSLLGVPTVLDTQIADVHAAVAAIPTTQNVAHTGSAAFVIVMLWLAETSGIKMPPEVAVTIAALVGTGVHWALSRFSKR